MADYVLSGKVVLDSSGAEVPVKNLKRELKEATLILQTMSETFGASSEEAVKAAKKVAELKDAIGDAKGMADAFNPDAKFNAFAGALTGVVGGFTALQGSMALFGSKSEEVEKTLAKVQGAMALSQGLNSVIASKDEFIKLGAKIKDTTAFQGLYNASTRIASAVTKAFGISVNSTSTAFKALRGAIMSTGIGALVVLIGMLVDKIMDWTSSTEDNKAEQEKLDEALKHQNKTLEDSMALYDYLAETQVLQAKIAGKSSNEIREIERKNFQNKRDEITEEIKLLEEKANAEGVDAETRKKLYAQSDEFQEKRRKLGFEADKKELQYKLEDKEKQDKADEEAQKKKQDRQNKAQQKAEQARKEEEQATKQSIENTRKLNQEAELESIKDENARNKRKLQLDYENGLEEIKQSKAKESQKKLEREALLKKFEVDKKNLDDKILEEEKKNTAEYEQKLIEVRNAIRVAGIKDEFDKKREEIKVNYEKEFAEIDKNENLNSERKTELKKQLMLKEQQELDAVKIEEDKKAFETKSKEYEAIIADNTIKLQFKKEAIDKEQALLDEAKANQLITDEDYTAKTKSLADARISIQKLETEARNRQLELLGGALMNISNLAGQSTATGKALAIASTAISTYQTAQKAYASAFLPVPTPASPALGAVLAGVAVAQGIANIKKIVSTKIPSAGGEKSVSTPSVSSVTPPLPPQQGSTMINQGQINQLAISNATTRAYVLETDITNGQERIERINRASRIN